MSLHWSLNIKAKQLCRGTQEIKADLAEAGWEGVKLGGNYVAGVALGKCVEFGYDFATEVATYLEQQQAPASNGSASEATSSQDDVMFI